MSPRANKTMVFRVLPQIHLVVASAHAPTDAEWATYLDAATEKIATPLGASRMRTLVFTDGGNPTAAQRKAMAARLGGRPTRVALVTRDLATRAITTAISWFNPQIKSFEPEQVAEALAYLDLPSAERAGVDEALRQLGSDLCQTLGLARLESLDVDAPLRS